MSRESLSNWSCSLTKLEMIFSSSYLLLGRGSGRPWGRKDSTSTLVSNCDDRSLTGPMRIEFNSSELKVCRGLMAFLGVSNGDFLLGDASGDSLLNMAKTSALCLAALYLDLYFSFAADCSRSFYSKLISSVLSCLFSCWS